jgi:hypothetical protein
MPSFVQVPGREPKASWLRIKGILLGFLLRTLTGPERTWSNIMINTLELLWGDIRFSFYHLKNSPGFALIVILTLALGIGANTTVFSWINSTLLDPIPGIACTNQIVAFVRGETGENSTPPLPTWTMWICGKGTAVFQA